MGSEILLRAACVSLYSIDGSHDFRETSHLEFRLFTDVLVAKASASTAVAIVLTRMVCGQFTAPSRPTGTQSLLCTHYLAHSDFHTSSISVQIMYAKVFSAAMDRNLLSEFFTIHSSSHTPKLENHPLRCAGAQLWFGSGPVSLLSTVAWKGLSSWHPVLRTDTWLILTDFDMASSSSLGIDLLFLAVSLSSGRLLQLPPLLGPLWTGTETLPLCLAGPRQQLCSLDGVSAGLQPLLFGSLIRSCRHPSCHGLGTV